MIEKNFMLKSGNFEFNKKWKNGFVQFLLIK